MITLRNIQLLEPDNPAILSVSADDHSLSVEEGGKLTLQIGVAEYAINFAQAKLSADYDLIENDVVSTDADPLDLEGQLSNRTENGFTVTFDGLPDTINYLWNWKIRVASL